MAPVSIAPTVRKAIWRVTAKESKPLDHGRLGKFWEPDSDSECEDLGEVEPPVQGAEPFRQQTSWKQPIQKQAMPIRQHAESSTDRKAPIPAPSQSQSKTARRHGRTCGRDRCPHAASLRRLRSATSSCRGSCPVFQPAGRAAILPVVAAEDQIGAPGVLLDRHQHG